jgi:hypothetical protein
MIKKAKGKFHFYNTFDYLWFKPVLALKFMNFEDVCFKKSYSFLFDT